MPIDCHAHVLPREFPADAPSCSPAMEPVDGDTARTLVTRDLRFTAREVFFEGERRLEAMDASGVDAEVVSPMPPLLDYASSGRDFGEICRYVNESVARLCETDPTRMFGFGIVPLQDPELAAAELADVLGAGLRGVEIGSNIAGKSIGEEEFWPFFAEAERLGVPVFVHGVRPHLAGRLPASATGTFGIATEASLAAMSLIASGTAERFPGLRVSFSHGAGGFPLMATRAQYFWGGTWNEEEPLPGRGEGPAPLELARRFYYDALVFDRRALRYLIDMLGPDRLLLGSDFPAMPREDPVHRTVASMGLPEGDVDRITRANALEFLGIEEPGD